MNSKRRLIWGAAILGLLVTALLWFGSPPAARHVRPTVAAAGSPPTLYLPLLFQPEAMPPLPEVIIHVTADGPITASTFTSGSFEITNAAENSQNITEVRLDLSTALFMDMVFDPYGQAGDQVAKDVQVDSDPGVGWQGHSYNAPHDDGFDVLELHFGDFNPGERFTFSVDVDPTLIRGTGAPGPYESGSVAGLELIGSTVTVTFADSLVLAGQLYYLAGSAAGAELRLRPGLPTTPTMTIAGLPTTPAVVQSAAQVVQVAGTPWQEVIVLVVEGGLFTDGLPGGGFDLDPFEANTALGFQEYRGATGHDGLAEIPITLARTHSNGGLNHVTAVQQNRFDMVGGTAAHVVLELAAQP
ncbi:MAG: hypothetical protein AB1791_04810 [Chloroflexota bacterium]